MVVPSSPSLRSQEEKENIQHQLTGLRSAWDGSKPFCEGSLPGNLANGGSVTNEVVGTTSLSFCIRSQMIEHDVQNWGSP